MKAIVASTLLSLLLAAAASGASVGADVDINNRIHHQSEKLSEKHHDDVLDHDYDHEAFLGAEEAAEFDDLDPEESKRRLGVIVDQIDSDGDGYVTLQEMRNWIRFSHDRYMSEDVEKQWTQHNQDDKDAVGWEEYRQMVYGFLDEDDGGGVSEDDEVSYKRMENRDLRRWQAADEDGDGSLNKVEFKHFLHPEEAEHMKDIVVLETMEDIDKDGDGFISVDEYIGDMYQSDEGTGEEEPEWIKTERQQFSEIRDSNGDGKMDMEEVKAWILPVEYDHVEAEAKHLIFESDQDQDEKLTKEEILNNFELFVGSQATDFGEALTRHDEF